MNTTIMVGMADFKVGRSPDKLMTAGLGSCIGVCIYDLQAKIGGMAHIMLPNSVESLQGNPLKYADTCIVMMLEELYKLGVIKSRLKAKMAGGAQMFSFGDKKPLLRIGERNAEAVQQELKKAGIPLLVYDIGGNFGRTITFDIQTGDLNVRTINHGEKVI
ncbi:chemotaxis protein CheD [Dehalobacter sp. DCM]|uniref:chemotaxis protein CheD n=1 Tax=Dehalobacter sp. DCM TaxID=2907827 RepID=UPI0030820CB2|nr:chemotaxis protein CheD [Dehalobacter sp. DCM]